MSRQREKRMKEEMSEREKEREAIWNRRGTCEGAAIECCDSSRFSLYNVEPTVTVESPRFAGSLYSFSRRDFFILLSVCDAPKKMSLVIRV